VAGIGYGRRSEKGEDSNFGKKEREGGEVRSTEKRVTLKKDLKKGCGGTKTGRERRDKVPDFLNKLERDGIETFSERRLADLRTDERGGGKRGGNLRSTSPESSQCVEGELIEKKRELQAA